MGSRGGELVDESRRLESKLPPLESHPVESNLGLSADTGDPHN